MSEIHSSHAQLCPTLCNTMDCSPPGSSVHVDFPGKNPGAVYHFLLQGIFPTQKSPEAEVSCLGRWIFYCLSHPGSPYIKRTIL